MGAGLDGDVGDEDFPAVVDGVAARAAEYDAVERPEVGVRIPVAGRRPLRVRAAARPRMRHRDALKRDRHRAAVRNRERVNRIRDGRDAAQRGGVKAGREQRVGPALLRQSVGRVDLDRDISARVRVERRSEIRRHEADAGRELQLERRPAGHRQRRIRQGHIRIERKRPLAQVDSPSERVRAGKRQRGIALLHELARAGESLRDRNVVAIGDDQPARAKRRRRQDRAIRQKVRRGGLWHKDSAVEANGR